jgi:hypothetical protein
MTCERRRGWTEANPRRRQPPIEGEAAPMPIRSTKKSSAPMKLAAALLLPVLSLAVLSLAACGGGAMDGQAPTARLSGDGFAPSIPTQDYVPDVSQPGHNAGWEHSATRASSASASPSASAARSRARAAGRPPPRSGSSTPPDLLFPSGRGTVLSPSPPPSPPRSSVDPAPSPDAAGTRFKHDLLAPEVERLRQQNAAGRLVPLQQRDLMNREQELRQFQTTPPQR